MIAGINCEMTGTIFGSFSIESTPQFHPGESMPVSARIVFAYLMLHASCSHAATTILDEIVVTAIKQAQPMRETSSTVSALDSEELERISHTHINETLHRVPGVWISRGNGQEHLTAIRSPVLTGAGSCGAFLMMQDGVSLRAPGFCNVNELFESVSELADRIEVLKGPGSDVYGSNALHGAINVLTGDVTPGINKLKVEAGPNDYYRGRYTFSGESIRLDVSGTTDGGYKDDSGFDQQKLLLKHRFASAAREITTTLSMTNLNQETAGFIRGDEVYRDAGSRRDNPNPEAYRDARSLRLVAEIAQSFRGGDLVVRPYLRSIDMTFLQHFLPGQSIEKNGHDSLGLQTLWTSGQWRAGLEVEYTEGFLKETQPNATTGSAYLVATIPAGKHYDYDVEASLFGVFLQRQFNLTDALTMTAGVRFQYTGYDYDNRMISGRTRDDGIPCGFGGCRFNRPEDRDDSYSEWSPKIGAIYSISDNHQVFGQVSRGIRAPQAAELYRLQNAQNVTDIDPVKLDSMEVGFRGSSSGLGYSISLYAMEKDNFIFRDTSRQNVDGGETSHRGIEIDLDYKFTANLSASLSLTRANHRYENNPALSSTPLKGNDIDTAPRTMGSASLHWQPGGSINLKLEWVHISDYYEDPQNLHRYDGHDLLHLRGNWQVTNRMTLSARLMNLTDEDYAERADYSFGSDRYFVGTPFSIYLGISLHL